MARMEAHVAMANTLFWLGDGEETLACLARGDLRGGHAWRRRYAGALTSAPWR